MSNYPQMPPLTKAEIEAFLSQPYIAKISTINEDGTIQTVPIWFLYQDNEIVMGTQDVTLKIQNLKRNPNVTVLVDDPTPPFKGVIVYGKATLEYDDVIEKRVAIFSKYMPAEHALGFAQSLAAKWQAVIIRVKSDRIVSFDYAKGSLI